MKIKNHLALLASFSYLLACFIISGYNYEGSWGGFLYFVLALPFSIISLMISNYIGGMPLFIVLNAIWWYVAFRLFSIIKNHYRS